MDYKIKVESKAESEEAQELLEKLGFKKSVWGVYSDYFIFANSDYYSRDCISNFTECYYKEITLPQLRDLVVLKRNNAGDKNIKDNTFHDLYQDSKGIVYFYHHGKAKWIESKINGNEKYMSNLKPITKEEGMKEYLNPNQDYKLVTCKVGYTPIPSNWIEIPEGAQSHHINKRNDVNFFLKCENRVFYFSYGKIWAVWGDFNKDSLRLFTTTWQREPIDKNEQVLKEILEGELPEFEFEAIDAFIESNVEQDNVNQPSHYKKGTIECIDAIQSSMTHDAFCGYLKGNIQKYMWRYENKGGLESLSKAQWYLNKLIGIIECSKAIGLED